MASDTQKNKRPPIVVVMGHVDHGKTTLLDYIKKTNIAAREAGGITQSIGAYEIEHNGEKITFIDTPGHEAFAQMRARGSNIADIALLVVAADDGVKEQTKESYKILQESKTPFIVVINKIDKPTADIDRIKGELAQAGILLEGFGGDISWKETSATTGQGIEELLDLILLAAELEELTYNPLNVARGFVLESKLDSRKGVIASLIIKDGILKSGDRITAGKYNARIRSLENFLGRKIKQAEPSVPVLVLGFAEVPEAGAEFVAGSAIVTGKPAKEQFTKEEVDKFSVVSRDDKSQIIINVILKANDSGSLEALAGVVGELPVPENYRIVIINKSVGNISDNDVKFAVSAKAVIIGFNVEANKIAENLSEQTQIITSNIIYKLVEKLEEWLDQFRKAAIIGDLEVLAVFDKKSIRKQIIGGKVVEGEIKNHSQIAIRRNGKELGDGKIINLQQNKQDVDKVESGQESGLLVNSEVEIRVGDHLISSEANN